MKKKFKLISCNLILILIMQSIFPVVTNIGGTTIKAASVQTEWEFNYSGNQQTFVAPYKGIYSIEVYGAQGGNTSRTTGGNGSYIKGVATIQKNEKLYITVGGQNGYNGGGSGSSTQAVGGGATDIRINGTDTSNRMIVAGGGGGSYSTPNYHRHSGSSSSGGGCYTQPHMVYGKTGEHTEIDYAAGFQHHPSCIDSGSSWGTDNGHIHCGYPTKIVEDYGWYQSGWSLGCGMNESTIVSYTDYAGSATPASNGTLATGSSGGGGGYYGGTTRYAGTSYASGDFTNVTTTEGARSGNGYAKITLLYSYADVELSSSPTAPTNKDVVITATAKDDVVGLPQKPYSWENGERTENNTYTVGKNGTYKVNVINNSDMEQEETITITNIDKIAPVVNDIKQTIKENNRKMTLIVTATDSETDEYMASGVASYGITTTNVAPSQFQTSNEFTVANNGTYYLWAKDNVGNISLAKTTLVKDLEIDISGTITWNDSENKFNSRLGSVVKLYKKVGNGAETLVSSQNITPGQTSYSFTTRETNDEGQEYTFRIEQNLIDGYETLYSQNNVTNTQTQNIPINITNNLILPTYTSSIDYNLIDAFENKHLKNTQAQIVAQIKANSDNREHVGLNKSKVVLDLDLGTTIDKNKIEVTYTDGKTGVKRTIDDFIIQKNTITVNYGLTNNYVTKAGDILTIKVNGVLSQIKDYKNSIILTGNLTDYRGTNTNVYLGEVTKAENNFTVENQKPQAKIKLKVRDSITEANLANATFTLYEWNGQEYIEKEILTDSNNDGIYESSYYEWNGVTKGKYKIAQTGIPTNHKELDFSMEYNIDQLKTENYEITPDYDNGAYRIAYTPRTPDDFDNENGIVENEPYKLKASIKNIDSNTHQEIQSDAVYTIYEWDNTTNTYKEYASYTNSNKVEMSRNEDKQYVSSQWLYYTDKNEGKYKIVETTPAYGYCGDYDENGNKREYEIDMLDIIESGKYEEQTVENEGTILLLNNNENVAIQNNRITTEVNISIIDKETKSNKIQASATLEGAEYEIYAREQINHSDGVTSRYPEEKGVLYKKDELVKTVITDAEGKIQITDLENGKYYIKQKVAPTGYVKDENTYELDLSYQNQDTPKIVVNKVFENKVIKQSFQILKQQNIGFNQISPLANAGFTIYEIKELSIVKDGKITKNVDGTYTLNDTTAQSDTVLTKKANENGTYNIQDLVDYYYKITYNEENAVTLPQGENAYFPYNISSQTLVKNYENNKDGELIQEIVTGQDGYVKSPELAYGEYIVVETSVPHNKEAVTPIVIKIVEDSRESQNLRYVLDPNFETKIKIYTKDIETGKIILKENAKFIIKNKATGELVTYKGWNLFEGTVEYGTYEHPFVTTRKGYIVTPMKIEVGEYELIQLQSTQGYVLNGYEGYSRNGEVIEEPQSKVNFVIGTNQVYFVDNELESNVIVTVQENKQQVGTLCVTVEGEKLIEAGKEEETYKFKYEKQKLEGVEIGLYAKEDIYTQDEQKTLVYSKGQLVKSIKTNSEGKVNFDNIPIGNYFIKEIATINGFALNKEEKDVTISYGTNDVTIEPQKTPVTKHTAEKEDIRQKVEITVTNKDQNTNDPISGTVIGIYAAEDIVNKDGITVVAKGELIEKQTTNEEGKVQFVQDLPLANYYLQEIIAATGYVENKKKIDVDATYIEDARQVNIIEKELQNRKTSIFIKAIDENENLIEGSNLQIVDEEGNIIVEWTSTNQVKEIQKLEVGKTYILKQKEPIIGYVTIDEITFSIKPDGDLTKQLSEEKNTIMPVHRTTKLEVYLKDKETKEPIPGSKFQIITTNEDKTEKVVCEFAIGQNGTHIEKLAIGKYILRQVKEQEEVLLNKGYATLEDVSFEIKDTKEVQIVDLVQEITKVEIQLLDKDTNEQIEGATLQIIKQTKEEDKVKEEIIEQWDTGNNAHYIERLPVGTYILRQTKAVEENGDVTTTDVSFTVQDTIKKQIAQMKQSVSKVEIELKDKSTNENIEGATLQILKITKDKDGKQKEEIIKEIITQKENSFIERLPIGNYILRELEENIINNGYTRIKDSEIIIIDTEKTQKIEIKQDYTKLSVEILDKDTKEGIIGATLYIEDAQGKVVVEDWISDGKPHNITKLPVGKYKLIQKEAPHLKGYVEQDPVEFEIEETEELQTVQMQAEVTKVKLKNLDSTSKKEITQGIYVIKDDKGNQIATLSDKNEYYAEKLPIGTYTLESIQMPYGYKSVKTKIQIKNTKEIQTIVTNVEREKFDLQVQAWIKEISKNSNTVYTNKNEEQKMKKIDIKDKLIKTEQIKVVYKIRVENVGKITGKVGKIEVNVPQGMIFVKEDNKSYWKEENGKVVTTGLSAQNLKEGAKAEIEIVLRWKNGLENFGTKQIQAQIQDLTSDIGFEETNKDNNKAKSAEIIIGVSTGEMSLVWLCWILLIALILIEVFVTKKLKIKSFKIKDKTLKYRNKK